MRPPPNLSQHQPGSRARHGGSVAAAGLVQGGTIKPIPGRKNHKVELNTVVNYKQYVLRMMVFRQIPHLILINWMQDFDQHEKNRHCGSRQHPRPVQELSRTRTSRGKIFPVLCCSWWLRQFEQGPVVVQLVGNFCAETRRMLQLELIPEKIASPATTVSLDKKKGGRGGAKRGFLLQKKKCFFPGTCMLKWIEMQCELKKYLETEVIVTFLGLGVHGAFLSNT
ncbi:uncharacterized protein LOC115914707 isoform X2 [Camarhynchus parvulus]|uniref:uncharacterized protein LOC115914707 isoform X2 n=1 Tax=Geospiza parvula TaxID=87175 RepID=UPI001237A9B6|nr:uncharacterized protein LOC115914707 isoform X2 [Camarhynchus parvulus]